MAKLMDISAIYGQSNKETVMVLIANVFENDKRYVQDFKEGLDLMINLLKKLFKDAVKVNSMIVGDTVYSKTASE